MSSIKYLIRQLIFIACSIIELFLLKCLFSIYLPANLIIQVIYIFIVCLIIPNIINLVILYNNKNISYLKDLFIKIKKKVFRKNA